MGGALNAINCLNLVGFILNVSVTAFASQIFNFSDNATISAQYQTIITPSGFTFAIWGIIFLSQLIFTIAQMLPQYRSLPIVQDGVHYLYVYACLAQSAWTFLFGYEIFWLSVIIMFSILVPLYRIVMQQQQGMEGSLKEYWLFKFPFQVHCGWITVAFLVNVNLTLVAWGANDLYQVVFACLSLGLIILATYYVLFQMHNGPNYTIPSVFAWANFGIAMELNNPKDMILNTFSDEQITTFRMIAASLSVIILVGTTSYGIYYEYKRSKSDDAPVNACTPLVPIGV